MKGFMIWDRDNPHRTPALSKKPVTHTLSAILSATHLLERRHPSVAGTSREQGCFDDAIYAHALSNRVGREESLD
jgi:hypothetical protein